jgi:hypothetical protein
MGIYEALEDTGFEGKKGEHIERAPSTVLAQLKTHLGGLGKT